MCGRFVRKSQENEVAQEFGVLMGDIGLRLVPSYNIAPGDDVAVVIQRERAMIESFRWGLPLPAAGNKRGVRAINARAETVSAKPGFKEAFRTRRCLIIADGFYEWGGMNKGPYYFHLKDSAPMGLAGLYGIWPGPGGREISGCVIITTTPNALVASVHDRMPAIISRDNYGRWLDNSQFQERSLTHILGPYPPEMMAGNQVGPLVNSCRNNSIECIKPI